MITRTTSTQINDSLIKYMANTQGNFSKLTQQLATGKKLNSITDDSVAAKAVLNTNKSINLYNSYKSNMKNGQFELNAAEDTLKAAETQASRALDIALMASNGTYGKDEMLAFKQEVDGIIETMESLANTKYLDTYIFSGTASLKPTYNATTETDSTFVKVGDNNYKKLDADGNVLFEMTKNVDGKWVNKDSGVEITEAEMTVTTKSTIDYQGTDSKRTILIGDDGLEEDISILGSSIFGQGEVTTKAVFNPDDGTYKSTVELGGDAGILASLYQLSAAIESEDAAAITESVGGLQSGLDNLASSKAEVGIASNRFDNLITAYDNNVTNLTDLRSSLQDADLSSLITEWTAQQYALEAAYSISAQMMGLSIMNYI